MCKKTNKHTHTTHTNPTHTHTHTHSSTHTKTHTHTLTPYYCNFYCFGKSVWKARRQKKEILKGSGGRRPTRRKERWLEDRGRKRQSSRTQIVFHHDTHFSSAVLVNISGILLFSLQTALHISLPGCSCRRRRHLVAMC